MAYSLDSQQKVWILSKFGFLNKSKILDLFRHSWAMHLYRNGMPLQLLSEFMGHASLASTQIHAYADTEMKRQAIEKSSQAIEENISTKPAWQTDEEMIRKLYGLE